MRRSRAGRRPGAPGPGSRGRPAAGRGAGSAAAGAGRAAGAAGGRRRRRARDGAAGLTATVRKPHLPEHCCLPPAANPDLISQLAEGLALYGRPYDPRRPQVCRAETSRPRRGAGTPPLAPAPGRPARADDAHTREGGCSRFRRAAPRRGWRHVVVSDRRTRLDCAHGLRELLHVRDPTAARSVLVLDNLTTHRPAARDAAFPPAEATRRADKLARHATPTHGSWRNLAEIALGVLAGQCRGRRLPDRNTLARAVAAWPPARNAATTTIRWRFTTADARIKPRHPYPPFHA